MKNVFQEFSEAMSGILIGWFPDEPPVVEKWENVPFLSRRAKNCLICYPRPLDPEFISKVDDAILLREPNLGRTTLKEIRGWCATHGFPYRG